MALTDKDLKWLRLAASTGGMYPGVHWDLAPKRFRKLERMGLVRLFSPHNMAHKDYAAITPEGQLELVGAG
jgi:hypothetical protein